MTQADNAPALRMSLTSEPTGPGQATNVVPLRWAQCIKCGTVHPNPVLVGIVEAGSGSGWSHYACRPCAEVYARSPLAPEWLRAQFREAA